MSSNAVSAAYDDQDQAREAERSPGVSVPSTAGRREREVLVPTTAVYEELEQARFAANREGDEGDTTAGTKRKRPVYSHRQVRSRALQGVSAEQARALQLHLMWRPCTDTQTEQWVQLRYKADTLAQDWRDPNQMVETAKRRTDAPKAIGVSISSHAAILPV